MRGLAAMGAMSEARRSAKLARKLARAAYAGARAYSGDEGDGPIRKWTEVATPARMQARLDDVKQRAASLTRDIVAYKPNEEQAARWSRFAASYGDWTKRLNDYRPDWLERVWGSTGDQIEGYAEALNQWTRDYEAFTSERASQQPDKPPAPPPGAGGAVLAVAAGVALGIGLVVAVKAVARD